VHLSGSVVLDKSVKLVLVTIAHGLNKLDEVGQVFHQIGEQGILIARDAGPIEREAADQVANMLADECAEYVAFQARGQRRPGFRAPTQQVITSPYEGRQRLVF